MVFSTHLAFLVCLCAALPLAVPARAAAHVQPRHSISPDTRQRTHGASLLGGHGYDGKNEGHQMRAYRAPDLPPLLRRHDTHGPKQSHDHHDHGTLDDAHHKNHRSRSAFARSRYHREPANFGRRSSVYVPGENGDMYIVSRTPTTNREHGGTVTGKFSYAHVQRQVDESSQVLGRIDIMVDTLLPGKTQRLASLTVDSTPIDWTSGQSSTKAFQLNASKTNQTQFIMLPAHDPSDAAGDTNKHVLVTLATEVFDPSDTEMIMYCATYNPDAGTKSALVMTPCDAQSAIQLGNTNPCADGGADAPTPDSHESQLFTYDPSSGQVAPIAATPSSLGTRMNEDDSIACAAARVRRNGRPTTTTSSPAKLSSASTSTKALPSGNSGQARNVTLVYVATTLQVPASSSNAPSNANTTKAGADQAEVTTTTVTTTVVETMTVTVSASSSGQTATPARAAASPTTTPGALVNAKESLEVEVIGITGLAVTSSSSTMTTKTTSSSSGSSAHPSLDPQAVASMIANSRGHRRVRRL